MLIQAHPGLRLQVRRIGAEGAPLLVVDDVARTLTAGEIPRERLDAAAHRVQLQLLSSGA